MFKIFLRQYLKELKNEILISYYFYLGCYILLLLMVVVVWPYILAIYFSPCMHLFCFIAFTLLPSAVTNKECEHKK